MLDPVAGVGAAARIWGSDLAGQVFTDRRGTLDTVHLLGRTTDKQAAFYQADQPGLLAASKLVLGWPLTIVAVVLTLALIRRTTGSTSSQSNAAA